MWCDLLPAPSAASPKQTTLLAKPDMTCSCAHDAIQTQRHGEQDAGEGGVKPKTIGRRCFFFRQESDKAILPATLVSQPVFHTMTSPQRRYYGSNRSDCLFVCLPGHIQIEA